MTAGDSAPNLAELVAGLGSSSPRDQKLARDALLDAGADALPGLVSAFDDADDRLAYEILRVLAELREPSLVPLFVGALASDDEDVRFVAAEAMIALERIALDPLCRALRAPDHPAALREGAAYILRELAYTPLAEVVAPLVVALDDDRPDRVPMAADQVLAALGRSQSSAA